MRPASVRICATVAVLLTVLSVQQPTIRCEQLNAKAGCNVRQVSEQRQVCVCNKQQCDTFERLEWPSERGHAIQVDSSEAGKRFNVRKLMPDQTTFEGKNKAWSSSGSSSSSVASGGGGGEQPGTIIRLEPSEKYQRILGWGGAFTDSSALLVMANLSERMSKQLLESYFGQDGLQYNFGRVPLGGADFSTRAYSYDDNGGAEDLELEHWRLAREDLELKIPMIKEAQRMCASRSVELKLFASPWSPPAWMKTSRSLIRGRLRDEPRVYQSYANYLIKFYRAYREHEIRFWGATLQNEPIVSSEPSYFFNSLEFNSSQQIEFVANWFGPALEANGLGKDQGFKLMLGDDSLTRLLPLVTDLLAEDSRAARYFTGLAFHWYDSQVSAPYDKLAEIYDKIKHQVEFVMMSEACSGNNFLSKRVALGSWERADAYALDIIEDLLRHTGAWIDWNLALDLSGGPNWANNLIDSPILIDSKRDEFLKQPMYYALAHFSRFFRPDWAVRVGSRIESVHDIRTVAVLDEQTNHLIVNILNRSFRDQTVRLEVAKLLDFNVKLDSRSINTIIIKL